MKKFAAVLVVLAIIGTGWMVARAILEPDVRKRVAENRAITSEAERSGDTTPAEAEAPAPRADANLPSPTPEAKPVPYRVAEDAADPHRAVLRVQVVDRFNQAIEGAKVRLTVVTGGVGRTGQVIPSDGAGQALFRDLHAEEVIAAWVRVGSLSRTAPLRLTNGKVTELRFKIPGGVAVRGTIRDAQTGPLAHVVVALEQQLGDGFTNRAYGYTDEQGVYAIEGVPPGKYEIRLAGGKFRSSKATKRQRKIQYHERRQGELEVTDPGPTVRDITLGRLSIEGTVRDADTGLPIPGVSVMLLPRYARTTTDELGRFRVTSMPPGKYQITLMKDGYALRLEKNVELRDEQVARVEFGLNRAAKLHIHIQDPDGKPVTGEHWFSFERANDPEWTINLVADSNGHVLSEVIPLGTTTIRVSGAGWKGGPVKVDVKLGENHVTIPLARTQGPVQRSLSGIVRNQKGGAPIRGARLRVRAGMTREVYSDEQGRFVFEGLPPGSHVVRVSCDRYGNTASRPIKIATGAEAKLEIELVPATTIHLRVTDATGKPVVGKIHLAHASGTPRVGRGLDLELDEDGRVSFSRIVPGPCSMAVHVEGRGRGSLKCDIPESETTIVIQLEHQ